jgi:hypothetical protein
MEQINSDKCSNIELNFEYLDHFLIQIRRIFTDPIAFGGEVYSNAPMYNGQLFHLFSLEHYPTIEETIKYSFHECDEFLIEYPPESHQVPYQDPNQVPNEDRSLDDIPY